MKTFVTVFIAVILANVTTLVIYESYQQYKVNNAIDIRGMETVTIPENNSHEPSQAPGIKSSEEQRKEALVKSAENLCNYWTKEYQKDKTGLNEALKEKACLRYKKLKPAEPAETRPSAE